MSNVLNFPHPLPRKPLTPTPSKEEVKSVIATKTTGLTEFSETSAVTFLPFLRLLEPIRNLNIVTNTPNLIHPIFRFVAAPVAYIGAAIDIARNIRIYDEAGCDDATLRAMGVSRASYQLVNNFILPSLTFKMLMKLFKTSRFASYKAALGAVGLSLATSPFVSSAFDKYALNKRLSLRNYNYVAPNSDAGRDNWFGYTATELPTTEFLSTFPNFMLLEAAPLEEVSPALGRINFHTVGNVRRMGQGGLSNADGIISPIPAPTKGTESRFSKYFGDYALSTLAERELDEIVGLRKPADLSDASKAQMLENVKNLYNKLN